MTQTSDPPDPATGNDGKPVFPFPDSDRQKQELEQSKAEHHRPKDPLPPMGEFGLKRGIQPWMANLIAIGGIIGSAYFIGSGYLVSQLGPSVILL